ncbi:SOS response-associated peptidase [Chenggangzhangella methanolivorans]|uniref:SOS response-associated peptidase n=1 Tax=Chenggangzhangella methanolivorans TaxID=1437009 RepID=UPI0036115135
MCGRFALTSPRAAVEALTGAVSAAEFEPRYNISPSQMVKAVAEDGDKRLISDYRFGLSPGFATEGGAPQLVVNARAETAAQRPAFRSALHGRRCLVPADAWYEWKTLGRFKQPYLIRRADRALVTFAALWDVATLADGQKVRALAIVTTAAGADVSGIHDRMPAVVAPEHRDAWLDARVDGASLALRCLEPASAGTFETIAIGALINRPSNDGPEVQQPAPERGEGDPAQPRLI